MGANPCSKDPKSGGKSETRGVEAVAVADYGVLNHVLFNFHTWVKCSGVCILLAMYCPSVIIR